MHWRDNLVEEGIGYKTRVMDVVVVVEAAVEMGDGSMLSSAAAVHSE